MAARPPSGGPLGGSYSAFEGLHSEAVAASLAGLIEAATNRKAVWDELLAEAAGDESEGDWERRGGGRLAGLLAGALAAEVALHVRQVGDPTARVAPPRASDPTARGASAEVRRAASRPAWGAERA
eukprot:1193273-Prorocentrum_minimum.AAC.1